jgi:hypothetical protein
VTKQHIAAMARSAASGAEGYALLADGRSWVHWSPLDECEPEGVSGFEQVGTVRVNRRGRTTGYDRVTELVPGRRFGYTLVEGLPVRDYVATIDLAPVADGGTTIAWSVTFAPRWPGTGGLLRRGIASFRDQCAHGLAAYADQHRSNAGDG